MDLTDRIALRKPAGSDPFLRTDFTYNYDLIDDYPGVFVCTSSTLPTWDADQAGLLVHETDTGRIKRWTGAAFVTPNIFPKTAVFQSSPGVSIGAGSAAGPGTYTQAMGSFTPPRACGALIVGTCHVHIEASDTILILGGSPGLRVTGDMKVDGVSVALNNKVMGGATTEVEFDMVSPLLGYTPTLTAVSHALTFTVNVTDTGGFGSPAFGSGSVDLFNIVMSVIYLD